MVHAPRAHEPWPVSVAFTSTGTAEINTAGSSRPLRIRIKGYLLNRESDLPARRQFGPEAALSPLVITHVRLPRTGGYLEQSAG